MKHFRHLICVVIYSLLSYYMAAEMLSVSSDKLRLDVSDTDGGFILYNRHDVTHDWTPLLWQDKYPTSYIRIWFDNSVVRWDSDTNRVKHSANVTNDTIVLFRSDEYADMQLSYTLRCSDPSVDTVFGRDSLLITASICPHGDVRSDRMIHRCYSAADDTHRAVVRICYDTYLGETTGRHFTYMTQSIPQNVILTEMTAVDLTDDMTSDASETSPNVAAPDVTDQNIINDIANDVTADNSSDMLSNGDVTADKPVKKKNKNIPNITLKKKERKVSIWQRIFGRQRPQCDFEELPGTKIIDRECEFFRFAVPYIMSSELPNSAALHLYISGTGLTVPTRVFFANWKAANTEEVYNVRDDHSFGNYPFEREDSAAFFEYVIPNMRADETVDITAGVSLKPNAVFAIDEVGILPEISGQMIIDDVTADSEMDRLLNGINSQLNSRKDVRQSGVDRTQKMLNEIKKK